MEDIEIISSPNITGMEDLEDYQKSPKKTDEKINETNDIIDENIEKVLNYSEQNQKTRIVPYFNILSINDKNCEKKGKMRLKGTFNRNIDKKFDFIIPLSYPSSSIKCTAPKIKASTPVYIDCKVQKEFLNKKKLIFEPTVIKKKNREVLFFKKYNHKGDLSCINYNQKLLEVSQLKYNAPYTFLQTNTFNKTSGKGISFHLLLFSLLKEFKRNIPINVIVIKKDKLLRNLQDDDEEQEDSTDCYLVNPDHSNEENIADYICNLDNITIDEEKDIEKFIIESNEISGLNEENTNPIKTDENIIANYLVNLSDPEVFNSSNISIFDITNITETDCKETGNFKILGKIEDKDAFNNIEDNFNIDYINPPDSGALCNYNNSISGSEGLDCHNYAEFEDEILTIGTQLINGSILLNKGKSETHMSCAISYTTFNSTELHADDITNEKNDASTDDENTPFSSQNYTNNFYSVKSSSGKLSGGTIAAIVISLTVALIATGVLIVLVKKGLICSSKSHAALINTNATPLPQASSNSIDNV